MSGIVLHELAMPQAGGLPPIIARVSGDTTALREAAEGLPEGAARPEAVAARAKRDGASLVWGDRVWMSDADALLRFCHERGASSIGILRTDPSLLCDLQLGSFFVAPYVWRVARRALCALPLRPSLQRLGPRSLALAADVAYWTGVRENATTLEWERLTHSSYVVLYYHRIAGERKPGQERMDVRPDVFERHMIWLRRLGLRPLGPDQLLAFHNNPEATLPRRSFVLAADDGFRDAVVALSRHADLRPYIFVNTSTVGGRATWADGEEVASWSELRDLAERGGEIASHSQTHVSLPELGAEALAVELEQSLDELRAEVPRAAPMLAYPHGRNDPSVRAAVAAAGYRAAFTSETGRNGAGTDPYLLRRVDLKNWDGPSAAVWKALTGELVPYRVERWKRRLRARRRDRTSQPTP
jgi:peptidoglycan/xylan/chitin deacetylase (PgdA/CDA1 family)